MSTNRLEAATPVIAAHIGAVCFTIFYTITVGTFAFLGVAWVLLACGFFSERYSFCYHGLILAVLWVFHIEIAVATLRLALWAGWL